MGESLRCHLQRHFAHHPSNIAVFTRLNTFANEILGIFVNVPWRIVRLKFIIIIMMNEIVGIYKYVVDGEYAERLHDVFKHSYFIENECMPLPYQNCKMQVKFSFEDGVFRVEETTTAPLSYIAEIICFFADSRS